MQWAGTATGEAGQGDTVMNRCLEANPSACKKREEGAVIAS